MSMYYKPFLSSGNKMLNSVARYLSVLLVAFSFIFSPVHAQNVLMSWEFDTYAGDESIGTATTVATNISSSSPSGDIERGAGLKAKAKNDSFYAKEWGESDLASAITQNDYMQWTITPVAGYQITISSIVYNFERSKNGPTSLTIRSSYDAYTSDLDTKTSIDQKNDGLVATITGVENVTSALSFRMYGYSSGGKKESGGYKGSGDDITIYGTISIIPDIDSEVEAPATQVPGASILSSSSTEASAVDVFRFTIVDQGTTDILPTKVTNIRLTPGASNTADWTDHIQGVTLNNGSPITIGTPDITDTYMDIPITAGNLDIGNNSSSDVTLAIYLNNSAIVDGAIISFLIDAVSHGFEADGSGSQFAATFPGGDILSNDFTVVLVASQESVIQAVAASEVSILSSIINDPTITAVTQGEQVWQLDLFDGDGTDDDADSKATNYTGIIISQDAGNQISDWQAVIRAVGFFEGSVFIPGVVTINQTNISFVPGSAISVPDGAGSKKTISMRISVQTTLPAGTEGSRFVFELSEGGVSLETATTSSQLGSFTTNSSVTANIVDVIGDRLNFDSYPAYPASTVKKNQDFDVSVEVTDANGNRDTDDNTTVVSLSTGLGTGTVSHTSGIAMTNGLTSWTDVQYTENEFFTIIASDDAVSLLSDTTGTMKAGRGNDLLVPTGEKLTVTGVQNYGSVTVEAGGTLDLAQGAIIEIEKDLSINGDFNDLGGTTFFNASQNQVIQSVVVGKTVDFNAIDISNSGGFELVNEININLINTLKLFAGANFDADGTSDLGDFTIVSTSTNTARIATIEDGATLSGNVVWQRSLRTGPAGNRNFGTPIQGQTLADISDDVYVQGVAELQPGAWENVYTYTEADGTIPELGLDGWTAFTSTANPVDPGIGVRIYLWDEDYATEQVISNRGLPNIGDGSGDVAVSGETYDFTLSYTAGAFDGGGWNFLANPYPCELDWDLVSQSGLSGSAVYIWNPSIQNYGTYNLITGVGGVTQYVSSGQGFFVKASNGSSTLSVSEATKSTADGNSFLKVAANPLPIIIIKIVSGQGKQDETAIAFSQSATDDYDLEYDAMKLSGGWVNLSSISSDGELFSINAMGENRGVQSIKLNIEPYEFGNYTMDFPKIKFFAEGTTMKLKDNFMDKTLVIEPAASYEFVIDKNKAETFGGDRFEIQFVEPVNFRFEQVQADAGKEFIMPVYADQLSDVMSSQLALGWDESELIFVKIEDPGVMNINDFDLSNIDFGSLSISSTYAAPLELPDSTMLFSIRFMINTEKGSARLNFERSAMSITAIDDIDMPFTSTNVTIDINPPLKRIVAGTVATHLGEVVEMVTIQIVGDVKSENKTDLNGAFSLNATENSDYIISASRSDDLKMNEGVTTADLIKTRRHILGIEDFASPYQIVAADVNTSNSVTALDLVQMRKVILGINEGFGSGLNWLFIPDSYDLSIDPFNFETSLEISLSEQDINLDFVAVKVGDVNNSWVNQGASRISNSNILFSLEHLVFKDDIIEIPVTASNFNEISGYQFSMTWDANHLDYQGIEHVALEGYFNENFIDKGLLTTLWDERNGQSINMKDGTVLFKLKFKPKDSNATSLVQLNSALTPAVAFDSQLNTLSINSVAAHVNLDELQNGQMELYQNVPNPFEQSTDISFRIMEPGLTKLSIINLLGETVYIHEQDYKAGMYTIIWGNNQGMKAVPPGIYLYRLENNGQELVKKMLIK